MLEQLKELEKKQREALLLKSLSELKELSKNVLESKEKVLALLEELGITGKDQKGIIDWINSLPDVKLDAQEKKKIREKTRKETTKKKEDISTKDISEFVGYPTATDFNVTGYNTTWTCSTGPMSGVTLAYSGDNTSITSA